MKLHRGKNRQKKIKGFKGHSLQYLGKGEISSFRLLITRQTLTLCKALAAAVYCPDKDNQQIQVYKLLTGNNGVEITLERL